MSKEDRFKLVKKALKMALITGASICLIATSLVGCMFHSILNDYDNTSYPDYNYSETYEEPDVEDDAKIEYDYSYEDSGVDKYGNESHNYRLYADQYSSLSSTISSDAFGLLSSKDNDNADRRLAIGNYQGIKIDLSQASFETFAKWVDSKDVTYVYADLYDISTALDYIDEYDSQVSKQDHAHTDLITSIDKIPSVSDLASIISRNSSEFLRNNKGYTAVDSKYVNMVSEIFVDLITTYKSDLSNDDITRIYCMLNDVVVVNIDSMDFTINDLKTPYNARVTEDGVIMLDLEQMKSLRGNNTFERTMAHEIIHIFQRMCADHQVLGLTQIGNSRYDDKLEDAGLANSLHFQWLYEASAEKMSMDLYGSPTPLVYKNMVGYLNTLDLITLISPGYSYDGIEVSQLSTDPNAIYEVFGAHTKEEKEEIIHMLYSICFLQTDREDFVEVYEAKNGQIEGQENTIKRIMKESIVQTMTKYFYKNLAERVTNSEVTLEDAFYLINVYESCLNLHLIYDDAERYELNKGAIDFYLETQNKFFEMVAKDSGLTFDEIVEQFRNYALVIKTNGKYYRNNSFTWLTEEEKEFVGKLLTTNISNLSINIRDLDQVKSAPKK